MKILVIHGPNLNLLGKRDPKKYGRVTLAEINQNLAKQAHSLGVEIEFFQANCEGKIIDFLQKESSRRADGLLINPGALVRYGYSLRQALIDWGKAFIEIHLSDIEKTGIARQINVLADIRLKVIAGQKAKSYYQGLKELVKFLREKNAS